VVVPCLTWLEACDAAFGAMVSVSVVWGLLRGYVSVEGINTLCDMIISK
jgi:hypothetical protein